MLVIAILILLLWPPIHQVIAVAAVQNSLERGWEINFGSQPVPPGLPAFVDSQVDDLLYQMFANPPGIRKTQPISTLNRDLIYQERFRAFFRSPIREIDIADPEGFRGDLGAALARFPGLRRFTIFDNEQTGPTEADWKLLCTRLRALPDLEEVALAGPMITDAALAPLSGHPKITKVEIDYARLTPKSIETFASMPSLRELHIGDIINSEIEWPTPETLEKFKAALPNVKLTLPENPPDLEPTPDNASP